MVLFLGTSSRDCRFLNSADRSLMAFFKALTDFLDGRLMDERYRILPSGFRSP